MAASSLEHSNVTSSSRSTRKAKFIGDTQFSAGMVDETLQEGLPRNSPGLASELKPPCLDFSGEGPLEVRIDHAVVLCNDERTINVGGSSCAGGDSLRAPRRSSRCCGADVALYPGHPLRRLHGCQESYACAGTQLPRGAAPVFAELHTYEATTHFGGRHTIFAIEGARATGEIYCLTYHVWTEAGSRRLMLAAVREAERPLERTAFPSRAKALSCDVET